MKIQKLFILILSAFLLFAFNSFAQHKYLKIEDPFTNAEVYPEYLDNITWAGSDNNYSWVDDENLMTGNVKNDKKDIIISLAKLNDFLNGLDKPQLKFFPEVKWINPKIFYFTHKNTVYTYNTGSSKLEVVFDYDSDAGNTDLESKNLRIAYTLGQNLFIKERAKSVQVTFDSKEGVVNGKSVHRDEFGINKGTFWSPDGNFLAFYRMDESMVTNYPLVKIAPTPAVLLNARYPMAGMTSHHVTLGIYNLKSSKTIYLKTGEPQEQYLTNITWSPDEKYIYIAVVNRQQNNCKLNKYDVNTGEFISTLFEESHDKYVEPQHPLYFLNGSSDKFVWLSRRDGFLHAYLYNTKGELINRVSSGKWEIDEVVGFDKNNANMFFYANKDNPIGKEVFSVNLKTGIVKTLTNIKGFHNVEFSPGFKYFIDQFSNSKDVVNRYDVISSEGKFVKTLLNSRNPLQNYAMGETSIFTLKSKDGSDLYCRMITPPDMKEGRRYPVFFYVYGGPHSQLVTDKWLGGAGLFQNYMAQKGYVVFTMDNRGTARRGADFEQAIFRDLGTVEMADQLIGLDYLKKQKFVDADRIGLHGWSYGGFMTLIMTLRNPGVFKASVAGGPVTDWKYYEVMYGERYMDTPAENPDGYENSKVMNYAGDLQGRLLLIHGAMDSTVVWQHSKVLLQKFIDEGKLVDYFIYPEQAHNMRGKAALHLYRKIEQYFEDHL